MGRHASISASRLRELVQSGCTMTAIARELGVSRQTVANHMRLRGIEPVPRRPGPPPKLPSAEQIVERIEAGETATQIARAAGVTRPAVVTKLLRRGYALRGGEISRTQETVL